MGIIEVRNMYSIKEIAELAGVTTRTLRYYDQMGILTPVEIADNGYRFYDKENLLRLQQVMFLRELDVPLKDIRYMLSRSDYHPVSALEKHRGAIIAQVERLNKLLDTLDNTIASLQGDHKMADKDIFEGFDETQYEDETRQLWGDTSQYKESQRKWSSYSKDQKEEIKQEGGRITLRMVTEIPDVKPDDPEVQNASVRLYIFIVTGIWKKKFRINQNNNLMGEGSLAANIPAGYTSGDLAARLSGSGSFVQSGNSWRSLHLSKVPRQGPTSKQRG
jgi:DNA-binding transcriptional MerR regulator